MTSLRPRIANLPKEKWSGAARAVFAFWGEPGAWENGSRTRATMTLANHPKLSMPFNVFGRQVLLDSTLRCPSGLPDDRRPAASRRQAGLKEIDQ